MTETVGAAIAVVAGMLLGFGVVLVAGRKRPEAVEAVDQALVDLVELAAAGRDAGGRDTVAQRAWRIVRRVRPGGLRGLPAPSGAAGVEPYVRRLLAAWSTGTPPDFSGCWVPDEVVGMVRAVLASGEPTVPLPAGGAGAGRRETQAERDARFDAAISEAWGYLRGFGPGMPGDGLDFRDQHAAEHVDDVNARLRRRVHDGR